MLNSVKENDLKTTQKITSFFKVIPVFGRVGPPEVREIENSPYQAFSKENVQTERKPLQELTQKRNLVAGNVTREKAHDKGLEATAASNVSVEKKAKEKDTEMQDPDQPQSTHESVLDTDNAVTPPSGTSEDSPSTYVTAEGPEELVVAATLTRRPRRSLFSTFEVDDDDEGEEKQEEKKSSPPPTTSVGPGLDDDDDEELPNLFPTPKKELPAPVAVSAPKIRPLPSDDDSVGRRASARIRASETRAAEAAATEQQERESVKRTSAERDKPEKYESYAEKLGKRLKLSIYQEAVKSHERYQEIQAAQALIDAQKSARSKDERDVMDEDDDGLTSSQSIAELGTGLFDRLQGDEFKGRLNVQLLKKAIEYGGVEQYEWEWPGWDLFGEPTNEHGQYPTWRPDPESEFGLLWDALELGNNDWSMIGEAISSDTLTNSLLVANTCPPGFVLWLIQLITQCQDRTVVCDSSRVVNFIMQYHLCQHEDGTVPLSYDDIKAALTTLGAKKALFDGDEATVTRPKACGVMSTGSLPVQNFVYLLTAVAATFKNARRATDKKLGARVILLLCRASLDRATYMARPALQRCLKEIADACLDEALVDWLANEIAGLVDVHQGLVMVAQFMPHTGWGRELQKALGRILACWFLKGPEWKTALRQAPCTLEHVALAVEHATRRRELLLDYALTQSAGIALWLCVDATDMDRDTTEAWARRITLLHGAVREQGRDVLGASKAKDIIIQLSGYLNGEAMAKRHVKGSKQTTLANFYMKQQNQQKTLSVKGGSSSESA